VVDLVGHHDKPVPTCQLGNSLQYPLWVYSTGRVVGVDDNDCLAARGDLRGKIVQVGQPPRFLVAEVVHRAPARQAGGGCPQWIVGGGDEHLITVVEQRLQRHLDQFTAPVAEPYVVDRGAADAALPVVL